MYIFSIKNLIMNSFFFISTTKIQKNKLFFLLQYLYCHMSLNFKINARNIILNKKLKKIFYWFFKTRFTIQKESLNFFIGILC